MAAGRSLSEPFRTLLGLTLPTPYHHFVDWPLCPEEVLVFPPCLGAHIRTLDNALLASCNVTFLIKLPHDRGLADLCLVHQALVVVAWMPVSRQGRVRAAYCSSYCLGLTFFFFFVRHQKTVAYVVSQFRAF